MFEHILLPLDGSLLAECVLPHAVALARAFNARITLLRVLAPSDDENGNGLRPIDRIDWSVRRQAAESYLAEVAERLQGLDLTISHVLLEGAPAQRVVEFVGENEVGLVILSSHGRSGLSRWNVSSVVQKILNLANISALIVRAYGSQAMEPDELRYRRVLVPVDGSSRAECALPPAVSLVREHQAQFLLAHAIQRPVIPRRAPPPQEDLELVDSLVECSLKAAEEYMQDLIPIVPAGARAHLLVSEDVATSLHELVETEQVDLVVMSAHGSSGKRRWPFGGLTMNFIQYGDTPLLIVQDLPRDDLAHSKASLAAEQQKGH
jgi:nucleotide-binding universal stress UspA family protein